MSQGKAVLAKTKLIIGIALFALSIFIPLLGIWVAQTTLPVAIKTLIIGILTFGGPEILAVLAVAVLGKEAFDLIAGKIFAVLGKLAPKGSVSRNRYKVGLFLFVFSFVPSYILSYWPTLVPENPPYRIISCICADIMLVASLFVLGGDFWDKLRALFVYDAVAQFPQTESAQNE
ncbi:MAG: hypothetical protein K2X77_03095 [Candidatus Obscuribacterales bacterium]|jgi:hypothetical protein|nr:hypothetical protein [Candidatus Obscuribacterales bacterium]